MSPNVLPEALSSPTPTTSTIWVNTLWLLSLVCSLTSALFATLIRQWARRYSELPHVPSLPSKRARVRSFLFLGTLKYRMRVATETTPTLLHLSMSLFLAGLIIFFFTIDETVAIALSILVGLFGMAYAMLTILPCIYRDCPYGTPMTGICWYLWHAFASVAAFCLQWTLRLLHSLLVPSNLGEITSARQRKLTEWLEGVENTLNNHVKCLKDGFRESIVQGALDSPSVVDLQGLAWMLNRPALAEKSKIEDFVASAPEDTIVQLMSAPIKSGSVVFRDHLLSLLQSCTPGTTRLDEDVRRRRLLVCLDAIHRIVKAPSSAVYGVIPSESVLRDVRINFASIGLMRTLWADVDPSICVISRSTCALLARHLVHQRLLGELELAWLQDVIGLPSNTIFNSLNNIAKADAMILDSYVYGVLSRQTEDLPVGHAALFMETFAILAGAGSQDTFRRDVLADGVSSLVRRAEERDGRLREVVGKLRNVYVTVFPRPTTAPLEPRISHHANRRRTRHGTIQLKCRDPSSTLI